MSVVGAVRESVDVSARPDREISSPKTINLCLPDASLNPNAMGISRQAVHRANLQGPWLRQKRWDAWGVGDERWFLMLGVMNLDYANLAVAVLYDQREGRLRAQSARHLLSRGCEHSETVAGTCRFQHRQLTTEIVTDADHTRLRLNCPTMEGEAFSADFEIDRPPGHESLNLVIPWSDKRYHVTSKQSCLPARGELRLGGQTHRLGEEATAWLDFARGIWPYRSAWNWAMCSGRPDGRSLGFNLGAGWTDGTGVNENAIYLDGRLVKIDDDVNFTFERGNLLSPWRIHTRNGDQVDLTFTPVARRRETMNLLVIQGTLDQLYGHYTGRLKTDDGDTIEVDRQFGVTEDHRARW